MKIAIVLSAPSLRQVFRGNDPRAVSIVTERALWPLLETGEEARIEVQCDDVAIRKQLSAYFTTLIADETTFLTAQAPDGAQGSAKA